MLDFASDDIAWHVFEDAGDAGCDRKTPRRPAGSTRRGHGLAWQPVGSGRAHVCIQGDTLYVCHALSEVIVPC